MLKSKFFWSIWFFICSIFFLASCGDREGGPVGYNDEPRTYYQWFSTTDQFTDKTFRCIESVSDYAIWCYENTTP